MLDTLYVAQYICKKYYDKFNEKIDEMKLHKLMYFLQRESFIQTKKPFFNESFYGWKFGPVLTSIRKSFSTFGDEDLSSIQTNEEVEPLVNKIIDNYGENSSWSLSRITHGEISWQNARKGLSEGENGNNLIEISDIQKDADKIQSRREMRKTLGLE